MCTSQELYLYTMELHDHTDFATTHEYVEIVFNSSLHEMKKIFVFEGTI